MQKKDMTPEDTLALNCYRTLLVHQIQLHLTFICSLKSHLPATVFSEGIAIHEHHLTKCIDAKGGYFDFSHLTELKNKYITEISMKNNTNQ